MCGCTAQTLLQLEEKYKYSLIGICHTINIINF